jgi:hypothetical protein
MRMLLEALTVPAGHLPVICCFVIVDDVVWIEQALVHSTLQRAN